MISIIDVEDHLMTRATRRKQVARTVHAFPNLTNLDFDLGHLECLS